MLTIYLAGADDHTLAQTKHRLEAEYAPVRVVILPRPNPDTQPNPGTHIAPVQPWRQARTFWAAIEHDLEQSLPHATPVTLSIQGRNLTAVRAYIRDVIAPRRAWVVTTTRTGRQTFTCRVWPAPRISHA
jgi:hypothetical protein